MAQLTRPPQTEHGTKNSAAFEARAQTFPLLSADEIGGVLAAATDLIALGIAATTGVVSFRHRTVKGYRFLRGTDAARRRATRALVATVKTGGEPWEVFPAYATLNVIRSEVLSVKTINYNNPFMTEMLASLSAKEASAVVNFIKTLMLAGPLRRHAKAKADREELRAIVDDATLEISVDEKVLLVQSLEIDVELKKAALRRAQIENAQAAVELAARIIQAQQQSADSDGARVWSPEQASAIATNVRLLASVDVFETLGIEVRVIATE